MTALVEYLDSLEKNCNNNTDYTSDYIYNIYISDLITSTL